MKNLSLKIIMVLSFCIILSNTFGKTQTQKTVLTNFCLVDTMEKATADTTVLNSYGGKVFIFNQSLRVNECKNGVGDTLLAARPIALKGSRFTVVSVMANGDLVISFWIWELNKGGQTDPGASAKAISDTEKHDKKYYENRDRLIERETFNFKQYAYLPYTPASIHSLNDNKRFFVLSKDNFTKFCSVYTSTPTWDINFGVLSTPFKLRFNRFSFSNNLSVGGAVYFQKKFDVDWSWGFVFGLSLSSVTLDAASTNVYPDGTTEATKATSSTSPLLTSTTRPAFTPSLHYLISYKNISFLIGGGFDFISKTTNVATPTNPEAGWMYNGKPWLGIGFGISLFNNNSSANTTPAIAAQSAGQ